MSNQENTDRFNQLLECLRPFRWSLFNSTGAYRNFTCLYSDGNYQKNQNYRLYQLDSLVRFLATQQNILSFPKSKLFSDKSENDICYVHRWNDFTRQVIIFHTEGAHHFDNYKLNDFLTLNDQFVSKKFIHYYQNYQLNQRFSDESEILSSL